jgi:dTDP-glucose 4,6-dehydratase
VELIEADAAAMPVPGGAVDFIIHSLVPDAGTPLPEMDLFFQSATQRLLDIAIQKNSRAFLLCSTGAVYQPKDPPAPFSEEDPLVPLDSPPTYGQIRRKVEDLCLDTLEKTPVALKIARGFAFVGPRLPLDANFAIGNFLRDALAGGPIIVKSDGTAIRSYLYAADMAAWLWTILLKAPPGRAFNVGSEEAVSIGDLARRVAKMFNVSVRMAGEPLPGAAPKCYLPSTQRARMELRLETRLELEDAIHKTLSWHTAP